MNVCKNSQSAWQYKHYCAQECVEELKIWQQ